MCGPKRPPFHASPAVRKGPISSKRVSSQDPLLRKFWNFSLYSLNFSPNFSSQAPKFGNFQLTSPQIWEFSVHKHSNLEIFSSQPFSEPNSSSQAPHFGNSGCTPLPEKSWVPPPPPGLLENGTDKILHVNVQRYVLLKGCGMCPWLVLVSPCFRENVVATCKIGSFLCSLVNLLQKNVIVLFFRNQISKWRSFEKRGIFDLLFTFFSHQGKVAKIPSAHISLTYIHVILLTLLTFFALPILKKIRIYQIRFLFGMSPGVDSYSSHFGAINK